MRKKFLILFLFCFWRQLNAQVVNTATIDTTEGVTIGKTGISGYIDLYSGYSYRKQPVKSMAFFVSSDRLEQLAINLAYIDIRYNNGNIRARLIPAVGTFMNANYKQELPGFRNLFEANAGILLDKKRKIWLDAGVLSSPITNESAISKDHSVYTRSTSADYIPYYLCGVKLGMPLSKKLNTNLFLTNGWQDISDHTPGPGGLAQLEYKPNQNTLINFNYFFTREKYRADSLSALTNRHLIDFFILRKGRGRWQYSYSIYTGSEHSGKLVTEGLQDTSTRNYRGMFLSTFYSAQVHFTGKKSLGSRIEFTYNNSEFYNNTRKGQYLWSPAICYNYKPDSNSILRLEARYLGSKYQQQGFDNLWLTGNLTVWF